MPQRRLRRLSIAAAAACVAAAIGLLTTPSAGPGGGAVPGVLAPLRLGVAEAHAQAQPAADSAGSVVVVRVGELSMTLAEVEARIARSPNALLRGFGSDAASIRRGFIDRVLVPELLAASEARARGIHARPDVADRLRAVLRVALIDDVRVALGLDKNISEDEVRAYYRQNIDRFLSPERVAIWRILVDTELDAKALLTELGASPDPKKWSDLARERSVDKATHLRGGNLGFVNPDGTTTQAGVRVDAALLEAAKAVEDGALVPQPVREGSRWAVVWKRQTMRAVERPLELEERGIRTELTDAKLREALEKLVAQLRTELVSDRHPELVDSLSITKEGEIERARRPGVLPRVKRVARPGASETPSGLR
jgi:peptidyl-prolyl cis-trans isomerase C